MSISIADPGAHAAAQSLIESATSKNATFANLSKLVALVERAVRAKPHTIANFFSANMGANVPWDRGEEVAAFGFRDPGNMLMWRDVREASRELVITMSHAFSAVSMSSMPFAIGAAVNHSADVADGIIKGAMKVWDKKDVTKFSMNYGYGQANQRGDWFGTHMAGSLTFGGTLAEAYEKARRRYGYE